MVYIEKFRYGRYYNRNNANKYKEKFKMVKINKIQAQILLGLEDTKENEGVSRKVLSEILDKPEATLYYHLIKLWNKNLVDSYGDYGDKKHWGRPPMYWYTTELGNKAIRLLKKKFK